MRFNEILAPRFARHLQKVFGIKGAVPVPTLASDVAAVYPLFAGVEQRYHESWERFAFMLSMSAVALKLNNLRFRNPVGSNVVAVVEKLKMLTIAADNPFLNGGTAVADLVTVQVLTGCRLDARSRPTPTCIISNENVAAVTALTNPVNRDQIQFGATGGSQDVIIDENQEMPVLAGDAFQVQSNTAAVGLTVAIWWRERVLEETERT
jgi:hypothetical protein